MSPCVKLDDVSIYEKPGVAAGHLEIAAGCAVASLVLVVATAIAFKPGLVVSVPLLLASLLALARTSAFYATRTKPAIVLSRDGLTVRSIAVKTIPWATIKGTARFRGLRGPRLSLIFDNDQIRGVAWKTTKDHLRPLVDVTLVPSRYDIDIDVLQRLLDERIATAGPSDGGVIHMQTWSTPGQALGVLLILLPYAVVMYLGFQHLHETKQDAKLRALIAAPNYAKDEASRESTATKDIIRYPRDTRVRFAYANLLVRTGQLAAAQSQLEGALQDGEADRAMSAIDGGRSRGVGLDLHGRVELLLAVVLAERGEAPRAKRIAAGFCRDVPTAQMPPLERLDLCHFSARSRRTTL